MANPQRGFKVELKPLKNGVSFFKANTNKTLADAFLRRGRRIINDTLEVLRYEAKKEFKRTDTYKELTSTEGILAGEFGFSQSERTYKIDSLIEEIIAAVQGNFTTRESGFGIRFSFFFFQSDFSNLLNLPEANSIHPTSGNESGLVNLPWLQWLLTEGDRIIISDFFYSDSNSARKSAWSEQGIMLPSGTSGFTWGVPAQFAGTAEDNWLTRVFLNIIPFIRRRLRQYIIREVKI